MVRGGPGRRGVCGVKERSRGAKHNSGHIQGNVASTDDGEMVLVGGQVYWAAFAIGLSGENVRIVSCGVAIVPVDKLESRVNTRELTWMGAGDTEGTCL